MAGKHGNNGMGSWSSNSLECTYEKWHPSMLTASSPSPSYIAKLQVPRGETCSPNYLVSRYPKSMIFDLCYSAESHLDRHSCEYFYTDWWVIFSLLNNKSISTATGLYQEPIPFRTDIEPTTITLRHMRSLRSARWQSCKGRSVHRKSSAQPSEL